MNDDELAALIAHNLPTPFALDIVWRQDPGGPVFDLSDVPDYAAEEWRSLARAVREGLNSRKPPE